MDFLLEIGCLRHKQTHSGALRAANTPKRSNLLQLSWLKLTEKVHNTLSVELLFFFYSHLIGKSTVGLFRVIEELKKVNGIADNLLTLDAIGFLASRLLSYSSQRLRNSLRLRNVERGRTIEKIAGRTFLIALGEWQ